MELEEQALRLLNSGESDLNWFSSHYNELIKRFDEKFVAVANNTIIANGNKFEEVLKKIKDKNMDPANVLIRFISKMERIL